MSGEGTSAMPIFVRGVGTPSVASILDVGYYGNAAYIIVEGIKFANGAALRAAGRNRI